MSTKPMSFFSTLDAWVNDNLCAPICVGIDPNPDLIPKQFWSGHKDSLEVQVHAISDFCFEVLEALNDIVPVVKFQSAYFEALGSSGFVLLEQLALHSKKLGLLTILDAKRGDIGATSQAYARAYLSRVSPVQVDSITVNPFLGVDALSPMISASRESGKGVFVCARTSNYGAEVVQLADSEGVPVFQRLSELLANHHDSDCIGMVVGATFPEAAAHLRSIGVNNWFLVPGVGAQGGSVSTLGSFRTGPRRGALISASRSVTYPDSFGKGLWSRDSVRTEAKRLVMAVDEVLNG